MKASRALVAILLTYLILALTILGSWQTRKINTIIGDEPHYLVIARGIAFNKTLEQTIPYREEFRRKEFFPWPVGVAEQPSPQNTHAIQGPRGLFNVHNIGLPLLLTPGYALGGVFGAKAVMVLFTGLVPLIAWKFSSHFSVNIRDRLLAVAASTLALPFLPASNQLYPDLPAGILSLLGLYWVFTSSQPKPRSAEVTLMTGISFLPWLQIKFAATAIILLLALYFLGKREHRDSQGMQRLFCIPLASIVALVTYNIYAFGSWSGPYESGAMQISHTSLMVLAGLFFDQNHGFLLQNPLNLVGILSIGWLFKRFPFFATTWTLVFLSLIVPNSLHPNWYGGFSFAGRFQWAASSVFIVPTLYGLLGIAKNRKMIFVLLTSAGMLVQAYLFCQYAIFGAYMYNMGVSAEIWPPDYPSFYRDISNWLPMLYDPSRFYFYLPNYAWAAAAIFLLVIGFTPRFTARKSLNLTAIVVSAGAIALGSAAGEKWINNTVKIYYPQELPYQVGRIVREKRIVSEGIDGAGYLAYGPYTRLAPGQYKAVLFYSSGQISSRNVGVFDVASSSYGHLDVLESKKVYGTGARPASIELKFNISRSNALHNEFRVEWNGQGDIEVERIEIAKI